MKSLACLGSTLLLGLVSPAVKADYQEIDLGGLYNYHYANFWCGGGFKAWLANRQSDYSGIPFRVSIQTDDKHALIVGEGECYSQPSSDPVLIPLPPVTVAAFHLVVTAGWGGGRTDINDLNCSSKYLEAEVQYQSGTAAPVHLVAPDWLNAKECPAIFASVDPGVLFYRKVDNPDPSRPVTALRVTGQGQGNARLAIVALTLETAVTNLPPGATILSPLQGEVLAVGDPIGLHGRGVDPEGGPVTLAWYSDSTSLGSGADLTVVPLPAGIHTIELVATDDRGATGRASVTIAISAELAEARKAAGVCDADLAQGAAGLAEITRLLSLPTILRSSTARFNGVLGPALGSILQRLLATPDKRVCRAECEALESERQEHQCLKDCPKGDKACRAGCEALEALERACLRACGGIDGH